MTRQEITEYINSLENVEGYVQFSHRPLDSQKDIWENNTPKSVDEEEEGFIVEAHFFDSTNSITIYRHNEFWYVDEVNISDINGDDMQKYMTKYGRYVKMAQIWEPEKDKYCEDMEVLKLKKVVFAGFENA